jgi:hypothetical protein
VNLDFVLHFALIIIFNIRKFPTTNTNENVSEVYTKEFNATIPEAGHIPPEKSGIFPAAAHGWFVFLKPSHLGTIRSITKTV